MRALAVGNSKTLSDLIGMNANRPQWSAADLSSMLRHQLAAPLQADLPILGPDVLPILQRIAVASPGAWQIFGDVLSGDHPPIDLLKMIKDYARQTGKDQTLPIEIATAMYYASILAARTRCGEKITSLSDAALRDGAKWMIDAEWIDSALRQQISRDLQRLADVR
jgi:hypothetical protein